MPLQTKQLLQWAAFVGSILFFVLFGTWGVLAGGVQTRGDSEVTFSKLPDDR
jgi:hypothetical protein